MTQARAYRYDFSKKSTWTENPRVKVTQAYRDHECALCSKMIKRMTRYYHYPPGTVARRAHIKCVEGLKDE